MITRRFVLAGLAGTLTACQTAQLPQEVLSDQDYAGWYIGAMEDEPHNIPLVDRSKMRPELARQTVRYEGPERPGTIVVDIDNRFLYLVQADNTAIRYGIGVGRQGFSWSGLARVGRKGVWPGWGPTSTMLRINPSLPRFMAGGIDNPLGARALYLYQGDRDTLFRIHGTNEPWSIGEAVSSGCVRLLNEDIYDLYKRVDVGTTVVVRRRGRAATA